MNRSDPGNFAVKIANPKTLEFQVVRTSLLPGLLKTIRENRSHPLPIRLFELSDVVFKDTAKERQARNERHAAAVWCSKTAGFEVVHGLLDRAMRMLEVPRIVKGDKDKSSGYYIVEGDGWSRVCFLDGICRVNTFLCADPAYFPGRAAIIYYRSPPIIQPTLNNVKEVAVSGDTMIGTLGVLHPLVLANFEINYPCSALEFNIEVFLKKRP